MRYQIIPVFEVVVESFSSNPELLGDAPQGF
jgi:hypothetical protein